jgi:hypothetical protein
MQKNLLELEIIMPHFVPQIGVKAASKNVKSFVEDHKTVFWNIWKPMIPCVLAACFLDLLLIYLFPPSVTPGAPPTAFNFGISGLINAYFFAALAISWHRVVINGPDNFVPMNPFKPKKHELIFMLMCVLIPLMFALLGLVMGILGVLASHLSPIITVILIISALPLVLFMTYKISFYFPARATSNPITFKESFALTNNKRIWEFYLVPLLSSWNIIIMIVGYSFLLYALFIFVALSGEQMIIFHENGTIPFTIHFIFFLTNLPLILYFNPLITLYSITSLSNYYQYALQNEVRPIVKHA